MVGTSLRALCVALLVSLWSTTAFAQPAPTGYDCAPGTPIKGKGCSCPKAYQDKRDGEGKAICSPRPISYTGPQTGGGGNAKYDKLVNAGNDKADAYNCAGAQTDYEEALKVNPKGIEAMIGSGNCYARLSKWTNAHMRYDGALRIDQKNEAALWGKAEAYRQAYKKDDAIVAYKQYLVYFPDSVKAKAALEKLGVAVAGGGGGGTAVAGVCSRSKYPSRSADVCIEVSGTRITINGTEITGNPTLADFENVYGKPNRLWSVKDGVNKVHTWDKLGLIVYEPVDPPAGRAISATFPFKPMGMDYDPKTNFTGVFKVDGRDLTGATELSDAKARPGASQPYSSTSVVFAKGDFNVFMTGRNGPLDLVELSMWKNPKANTGTGVVTTGGGGGKYKTTAEVKVDVTNGQVTLNGVKISGKPTMQDIVNIYGKWDRVWDQGSGNRVLTWDNLGIVAYESRDSKGNLSGRCISTTFPFKTLGSAYDPKVWFNGSVTVDGRPLRKTDSIATVKTRPKAGQPYGGDSIVFDWGDVHVFTQDDDNVGQLDLIEVSYWNNNRGDSTSSGGSSGTSKGPVGSSADVKVEVSASGQVTLQGQTISGKPMLSDIKKIYGEPDRTWDKKGAANRIHTWDNLGIVVYEPFNGRAISLTMPYKATAVSKDFAPTTLFKGRVSLGGRGFYNFNTIGTIKDRTGATQPYGDNSVMFDFGDVHVFTTASKPTIETIDLVEVSFWNKNR